MRYGKIWINNVENVDFISMKKCGNIINLTKQPFQNISDVWSLVKFWKVDHAKYLALACIYVHIHKHIQKHAWFEILDR